MVVWAFKTTQPGVDNPDALRRSDQTRTDRPRRHEAGRRPVALSAFGAMLKNPYYIGVVRYRGVDYEGKHEPLIDKTTFELSSAARSAQLRRREAAPTSPLPQGVGFLRQEDSHGNECGCRLIVSNAKSRSKTIYPYFICIGRQRRHDSCKQRALAIDDVEEAICDYYTRR